MFKVVDNKSDLFKYLFLKLLETALASCYTLSKAIIVGRSLKYKVCNIKIKKVIGHLLK